MATFKSTGGVNAFQEKLIPGMLDNGYTREFADRTFRQLDGFGSYGFPESYAASFALTSSAQRADATQQQGRKNSTKERKAMQAGAREYPTEFPPQHHAKPGLERTAATFQCTSLFAERTCLDPVVLSSPYI